jgi:hypothetical protein
MNLEEIKNRMIQSAQLKLSNHKSMGRNTNLSILEVAELLDVVTGRADEAQLSPDLFIGTYSLN